MRFFFAGLFILFFLLTVNAFSAEKGPEITVLEFHKEKISFVSKALSARTSEIKSLDPNFPGNTLHSFHGAFIGDLVSKDVENLTLLSADQYMAFFPMDFIREKGAMLAWSENGRGIPRTRGGPLKLIFEKKDSLHPSANAWYVTALIPGKGQGVPLRLVKGDVVHLVSGEEYLEPGAVLLDMLVPVPKGYRHTPLGSVGKQEVRGFIVEDLLKRKGLSFDTMILKSLAGRDLHLERRDIEGKEIFLFSHKDGVPLSVPCGGPWFLWVPPQQYPQLAEKLPNPDSLFFIHEIVLE
ncbi:hypothetical protein [Desulfobotulus mexicanus]|uniref:Molybdopterin-dependent oxidoreductase n=1 Tax=Desulfobotulus mexicanus TaxID=2586642 RepID=A0A5Q4VIW5_9BACT|nr:hypothetical protein [Desulfobotulus mexicanus]TYT76090.1 hypothetical protein FIM25_00610 [Desulfobotulus mexicanus]